MGFTPVVQEFAVNASAYLAGVEEMVTSTDALAVAIDDAALASERLDATGMGAGGAAAADNAAADAATRLAEAEQRAAAAADEAAASQDRIVAANDAAAVAADDAAVAIDRLAVAADASIVALDEAAVAADRMAVASGEAGVAAEGAGAKTATMGAHSKTAFLALAAGVVYSTVEASKFQTQVTRLYTAAGLTGASMAKVSQSIIQVGDATGFTGTQIAEAMYHPISAGLSLKAALAAVAQGAQLAQIHGANLDDTMYALSSIMKAFNVNAGGAAKTAALLNAVVGQGDMRFQDFNQSVKNWAPTAASMGISIQSMGAGLAYLTDRGNSAEVASTRLTMGLSMITAGSKAANVYLKDLGMTTGTLDLKNKSLQATMLAGGLTTNKFAADLKKPDGLYVALHDLQGSFNKAGLSAAQADQVMAKIFGGGRSDKAILSLMSNLEGVKQKYNSIGTAVSGYGSSWAKTQETVSFQAKKARADLQNLAITFGEMLLPAVLKILTALGKFFQFIEKHPLLAKLAGAIIAVAVAMGVLSGVMAGIEAIQGAFLPVLIIAAVVALAYGLYELYKRCALVREIVAAVANFFKAAWHDAMHIAGEAIQWFINGPLAFIKQQIALFSKWWQQNHKEIEQVTKAAWALISGYVKVDMAIITAVIKTALAVIKALWNVNWGLVRDIVKTAWNTMAAIIRTVMAVIRDTIAVILAVITGHWGAAWRNLNQLANAAMRGMLSILGALLRGFVGTMFSLGANLIMGFIHGMSSMAGNVIGMAKSIASSAISAVKSALGSLSPSKKAHYEGQMFAQGLVNGMDSYHGRVQASAGKLASVMSAGASASLSGASGGSSGVAGGTYNFHLTVNGFVGNNQQLATALQPIIQKSVLQFSKRNSSNGLTLAGH